MSLAPSSWGYIYIYTIWIYSSPSKAQTSGCGSSNQCWLVWFLAGYRVDYWVPVLNFEKKGSETGIGPQKPCFK